MNNPQIQKFKIIHEQLSNLINSEDIDEELLQNKIMKYIAALAEQGHPHHQEHPFDYFCQHNGLALMSKLLKIHSLIAIKAYSLLFINLKNQIWTNFMLCQPFVTDAIQIKCDNYEQQWTQYYISLLKSLSIRISDSQISVFYNKKSCTFPIVFQAMKYFNHPDFMVRTSVMNIILEMMKIKQEKTIEYFSRFPFTSYLITFCCEVYSLIKKYNQKLTHQLQHTNMSAKSLQNYSVDLSDYLYYFNDLITLATPTTTHIIQNCFFKYLTVPLMQMLASQNIRQAKHSMLILTECLKIIKDKSILQSIILLLLRPLIPKNLLEDTINKKQVHIPQVYTQQFDPNIFYWSKYKNDIVGHCLKVFDDISQFAVQYQQSEKFQTPQFMHQVNKMSQYISYDLLKNQSDKEFDDKLIALFDINQQKTQFVQNKFRSYLLKNLKNQKDETLCLVLELIIKIFQNKNVSKMTFVMSEIQRLAIQLKYVEQCQIHLSNLELEIKQILTQRLISINWKNSTVKQLQITLRMLRMLNDSPFHEEIEEQFYKKYKEIAEILRTYVIKQNINQLVQNFEPQYELVQQKMTNCSLDYDTPFAVGLLPHQLLNDKNEDISIPNTQRKYILHHVKQFWYMRNIIIFYFEQFYDMQYSDFISQYQKYFGEKRWILGKKYKIIRTKTISCDLIQKNMKKPQKVIIIQDPQMFVVAELQPEGLEYKIIVKVSWIKINFEMNRQQSTILQTKLTINNCIDKFNLIFDDHIRSSKILANFNDLKWQRYQKQLSFIHRFIEHVIHKE